MAEPSQWIQIPGALCLLVAFALLLGQLLDLRSPIYAGLNLLGAGLLAFEAWRTDQYGFLILEGTWAGIAGVALIRGIVARRIVNRHIVSRSTDSAFPARSRDPESTETERGSSSVPEEGGS